MTWAERGFLLLTSKLGNPDRKPLTVAQLRELFFRSRQMVRRDISQNVEVSDLVSVGYSSKAATRIVELLQDEMLLQRYLQKAKKANSFPITRATESYPVAIRKRLGLDSPGVLWVKGDATLLNTPAIALVGSRDLHSGNRKFAEAVGYQAARQGITLISGNARGSDKVAQEACLEAGGRVISIVADELEKHSLRKNTLYISEDVFDGEFSAQRALSRNRVIHSLGAKTFVAQCNLGVGGTWDGTVKNLQKGWSPVFCFDDGSLASAELEQLGATTIGIEQLSDFAALQPAELPFWE
ncbi:MAG: DNA-protecting protein DprA [Oscillospiraceae bacterium]|nr:DNA-protecting protein DprA [Oscillospiraceae bacterium]